MGKALHYFNEIGYGTRAKLVVNSLMGTMMAAFGESLALAESVGLDGHTMLEVIGQGAISSPMFAHESRYITLLAHESRYNTACPRVAI